MWTKENKRYKAKLDHYKLVNPKCDGSHMCAKVRALFQTATKATDTESNIECDQRQQQQSNEHRSASEEGKASDNPDPDPHTPHTLHTETVTLDSPTRTNSLQGAAPEADPGVSACRGQGPSATTRVPGPEQMGESARTSTMAHNTYTHTSTPNTRWDEVSDKLRRFSPPQHTATATSPNNITQQGTPGLNSLPKHSHMHLH